MQYAPTLCNKMAPPVFRRGFFCFSIELIAKIVIPVGTGIQFFLNDCASLDSRLRGNDCQCFFGIFTRAAIKNPPSPLVNLTANKLRKGG